MGQWIEKMRVTHVLTLYRSSFIAVPSTILDLPVISKHIDLEADSDPDQDPITESCKFIQNGTESGGKVLIYGQSSVESSAAACAYSKLPLVVMRVFIHYDLVMLSQNINFSQALANIWKSKCLFSFIPGSSTLSELTVMPRSEYFEPKIRDNMRQYFDQVLSPRGLTW